MMPPLYPPPGSLFPGDHGELVHRRRVGEPLVRLGGEGVGDVPGLVDRPALVVREAVEDAERGRPELDVVPDLRPRLFVIDLCAGVPQERFDLFFLAGADVETGEPAELDHVELPNGTVTGHTFP